MAVAPPPPDPGSPEPARSRKSKWRSLTILSLAEVLALGLWFSATATVPALRAEAGLGDLLASLFSSAVAVGFVAGTLLSAILGLADRIPAKRLFAGAAFVAAAANGAILLVDPASAAVVAFRFLTGACMAGIYPVGMKMSATWAAAPVRGGAPGDMGVLIGLLVGAVALGSAVPHLVNAAGGAAWRTTILATSALAAVAGLLVVFVDLGPRQTAAPPFRPSAVLAAWRDLPLRLANFGYFGHMWEIYAVWAWLAVFLEASYRAAGGAGGPAGTVYASLVTFGSIAAGGLAAFGGGFVADRIGRTTLAVAALATSGVCIVLLGLSFGGDPLLVGGLALVWGAAGVADSPQFSSCVIELSPPEYAGTMLTVQTCIGFLLTLASIHAVPALVDLLGWRYAFAPLAVGPLLGAVAMLRLRAHPDSVRLAGGRR